MSCTGLSVIVKVMQVHGHGLIVPIATGVRQSCSACSKSLF